MQEVFEHADAQDLVLHDGQCSGVRQVAFQSSSFDSKPSLSSPPSYSQHGDTILKEMLDYNTNDIQLLRDEKVIR